MLLNHLFLNEVNFLEFSKYFPLEMTKIDLISNDFLFLLVGKKIFLKSLSVKKILLLKTIY